MLVTLLQERFDRLSPEVSRLIGQASAEQAATWFKRAISAQKLTDIFADE